MQKENIAHQVRKENEMRRFLREMYELLFVMLFCLLVVALIALTPHEALQIIIVVLTIIIVETGKLTNVINYIGEIIYKKK